MDSLPKTRNADRTRRAVLDATVTALRGKGTGVALGDIAQQAGVSKGGLLHHFPSRDALFLAVAEDALGSVRSRVQSTVDLSENRPGKLLRAYVRVLCGDEDAARTSYDPSGLWSALDAVPGVARLLEEDTAWWHTAFASDGLHPDRILVVRHAAEGLAAAFAFDSAVTADTLAHARMVLLALTDTNAPIALL